MYEIILAIHNIIRWIALLLLVVVVVRSFIGWFSRREWSETDRKLGMFTTITLDIQLLLGLLLYIFFSPITKAAFQDFGTAMQVNDLRYFAVDHALIMVLAIIFAHLGSALPKRVENSNARFRRAAIWFTLALLLILAGMPWARPLLPGILSS